LKAGKRVSGRLAGRRGSGAVGQCFLFEDCLPERLQYLGLKDVERIVTHSNSTVMLSLSRRVLRIHRGYGFAPDSVLKAVIRFLNPRVPRLLRRHAEREFLDFPVHAYVPAPERAQRRDRPRPGDLRLVHRLEQLHRELNLRHFGGALPAIPIRISNRMKRRLGELAVDGKTGRAAEIALSRRHLTRHPWAEVEHTMLHEMVHQWQAEAGLPVDHGCQFRSKAREVGALPQSKRTMAVM
jgi:SprT-like family protein